MRVNVGTHCAMRLKVWPQGLIAFHRKLQLIGIARCGVPTERQSESNRNEVNKVYNKRYHRNFK